MNIGQAEQQSQGFMRERLEIATAIYGFIIQADLTEDGGAVPLCDDDFAPDETGQWAKRKGDGRWVIAAASPYPTVYEPGQCSIVSTPEQRRARYAIKHADALLNAVLESKE